jgi:orotate phosphoribosyltransferase
MTEDDVLDLFRTSGALLDGHFRLTSGLHSPQYLQSALVLRTQHLQATAVLSPALGGIVIGQEVARCLGIRALFAERENGALRLRRGFELSPSDRVLVVEDVITTGGSTMETARVAEAAGARVPGAAAIVDRTSGSSSLHLPLQALLRLDVPTFGPDDCPLCVQGIPVVKPGSRV